MKTLVLLGTVLAIVSSPRYGSAQNISMLCKLTDDAWATGKTYYSGVFSYPERAEARMAVIFAFRDYLRSRFPIRPSAGPSCYPGTAADLKRPLTGGQFGTPVFTGWTFGAAGAIPASTDTQPSNIGNQQRPTSQTTAQSPHTPGMRGSPSKTALQAELQRIADAKNAANAVEVALKAADIKRRQVAFRAEYEQRKAACKAGDKTKCGSRATRQ